MLGTFASQAAITAPDLLKELVSDDQSIDLGKNNSFCYGEIAISAKRGCFMVATFTQRVRLPSLR